jgi:hypothetical protein
MAMTLRWMWTLDVCVLVEDRTAFQSIFLTTDELSYVTQKLKF